MPSHRLKAFMRYRGANLLVLDDLIRPQLQLRYLVLFC
jgi:hypothetical protein